MLDYLTSFLYLLDSASIFQLENEFIKMVIFLGKTHESIQLPGENKTKQANKVLLTEVIFGLFLQITVQKVRPW